MEHILKISVSPDAQSCGVVRCKNLCLREKLLTWLLGPKRKLMVLIPGNSVSTLSITEIEEEGCGNEAV